MRVAPCAFDTKSLILWILLASALLVAPSNSFALDTECYLNLGCTSGHRSSSTPSESSRIRINPAAVPTEKGLGLEGIYYDQDTDLSLVQGTGKIGAALSPANSDETFFGAPGLELTNDLYLRKLNKEKYPNQKVSLATAVDLVDKEGSGLSRYALKVGVMGKYNKLAKTTNFGGGLTGIWGPFSVGYAAYKDSILLDTGAVPGTPQLQSFPYNVQSYNFGLYLSSLSLNYSHLRLQTEDQTFLSQVQVYTLSVNVSRAIVTFAKRIEDSPTPAYNYYTNTLQTEQFKDEYFGGIQFSLTKNFMIGALYNYYLLREYTATATLFF